MTHASFREVAPRLALVGVFATLALHGQVPADALAVGLSLPRQAAAAVQDSRRMLVEAVYGATRLAGTGRIVRTGTLVQGPGGWRWTPSPADRLVVRLATATHEFVVHSARGNTGAATPIDWIGGAHSLDYLHRLKGQGEARVTVGFDGSRFEARTRGTWSRRGAPLEFDLRARGSVASGDVTRTGYGLVGTIRGKGFAVEVDERHDSEFSSSYSLRLLPSMRGSASRFRARVRSVVVVGPRRYRFDDVSLVTDTRVKGTRPAVTNTRLEGSVSLDGKRIGRVMDRGNGPVFATAGGAVSLAL